MDKLLGPSNKLSKCRKTNRRYKYLRSDVHNLTDLVNFLQYNISHKLTSIVYICKSDKGYRDRLIPAN